MACQRLLRRFGDDFSGQDRSVFVSCVETIVSEVDALRDLVNEFSKFSRLPTIRVRPENLNDLVREFHSLYSMSYPDIYFDIEGLDKNVPNILLDKEQMGRVLSNLIVNAEAAIRESGREGKIEFSTKVSKSHREVRLEISDNGIGIPKKLKLRVLEPYFSTKKDGSGLGLAIVNQIIADHGGYLRLMDNRSIGTRIVIELPISEVANKGL